MITFFSGTPGSGKSLQMSQEAEFWLKTKKKNVIANVQINRDYVLRGSKDGGKFFYLDNFKFSPDFFYKYALRHHEIGVESQSLIIIDEAQFLFSPTAIKLFTQENKYYRQDWLDFFSTHRHLGFDILLVSQFDRLIDPQLRCLFEYNFVHRKGTNYKTMGKFLGLIGINFFIQIQYWYGVKEKCGSKIFFYKKRYSKIYNSYAYRETIVQKLIERYGFDVVQRLINPQYKADLNSDDIDNNDIVNL
jgi:Zonula occludens toxin